ncbi:MAG: universal stress protein [Cytophagaceae bacterium]|nr:universal stress protein [Cytophagaceae bacterium]
MKKILVPIDFSDYSNNAFRMATYFAKVKGMSIKLLHIVEEPNLHIGSLPFVRKSNPEYVSDMEVTTKEHLARMASLEAADGVEVDYEVRISKAGVAKEILKEECDVIMMGRRREENAEAFFTGSVAEKIVRLSQVPVITVGGLPKYYSINNIVFASDFEEPELNPILNRVFDLGYIFKAHLHFLYVVLNREFTSEEKSKEKVRDLVKSFDLRGNEVDIYMADSEEAAISQYVEDVGGDLLILCTHGRKGLSRFFIGSVSENMAAYASIPVLTYNVGVKKTEKIVKPLWREKSALKRKRSEKI